MNQGQPANGGPPRPGEAQAEPAATPAGPAPTPSANGPVRRPVKVVNPRGLHLRTAERFSRAARGFTAAVTVRHGDKQADGRSPFDLFLLLAFPGDELVVETDGPDAVAAADSLAEILADPGGEDYDSKDDAGEGI